VSVLLVKGRTSTELPADGSDPGQPGYRVGYTMLTVDDSKRFAVAVSADRDGVRPRQPAKVSVVVTGPDGNPRRAKSRSGRWLRAAVTDRIHDAGCAEGDLRAGLQVITADNRGS
jgi:hypothetical protein